MRHISLFWRFQLAGWLAFAGAMSLSRVGMLPLDYMIASKGVLAGYGLLVTLVLRALYRRLSPPLSPPRLVVLSSIASFVLSVPWTALFNITDRLLARQYLDLPPGTDLWAEPLRWIGQGVVYHAFVLLAWSVLYFTIKHHQALIEERERSLRAEALAQQAQLQALRYQVHPHFLFNALNAVSTLIVEGQTAKATEMLARIAEFLRYTLAPAGDARVVRLAEELSLVARYLDIEQVRFGERMHVTLASDPALADALVPPLILQPLVENAVRHGLAAVEGAGRLSIRVSRSGDLLRAVIEDSGPGFAPGVEGEGIGLRNVRERLVQHYGERASLWVASPNGGGAQATLEIPLQFDAPAEAAWMQHSRSSPTPA